MFRGLRGAVAKYWSEALRVITFFMVAAILILGISNFTKTQDNSNEQLRDLKKIAQQQQKTIDQLNDNSQQQKLLIADLKQHVDCIVGLFTQPNRANLTISNIQTCQLSATSSPESAAGATKSGLNNGQTSAPSNNTRSPAGAAPATKPAPSTNPGPAQQPRSLIQQVVHDITHLL